jgi:DNA repair photolyase
MASSALRWRLADDDGGQPALFDERPPLAGRRELPQVEYLHVRARRIVSEVPVAARVPFRYTINVYRGCTHACVYCFARPTHAYLGLDAGADFERRIVVKVNAVERLRRELADPSLRDEAIAMGTNTDPYQPCEGRYRLTRGVLETLVEHGQPFSVLTKSTMITRDRDVLAEAAAAGLGRAAFSIGTLREDVWRATEPGTPPPAKRVAALARLVEAGIPTSVLVAPIIPGLSDDPEGLDEVVRAVVDAGAASVTPILLHLRPGVREVFAPWLEGTHPDLVPRYAELYARRSGYAPEAEQRAVARRVHRLVERHRGTVALPAEARRPRAVRPRDAAHTPDFAQLSLGAAPGGGAAA